MFVLCVFKTIQKKSNKKPWRRRRRRSLWKKDTQWIKLVYQVLGKEDKKKNKYQKNGSRHTRERIILKTFSPRYKQSLVSFFFFVYFISSLLILQEKKINLREKKKRAVQGRDSWHCKRYQRPLLWLTLVVSFGGP